jgi:hypothetical protein
VIWSATAFLLEVPSGVWADLVDRRLLLASGAGLQAAAFATWMLWPDFAGYALGFVIWSLGSALQSGTFEALVYDELTAQGRTASYARLLGLSQGVAMAVMAAAIASAAPLYALGGYPLVGWVSVGLALLGVPAALALPRARPVVSATPDVDADDGQGVMRRYLATLAAGLGEASRSAPIRRMLVLLFLVIVVVAVDEYFALVASGLGIETSDVPWLIAGCSLLQAAGTAAVGWTASWGAARFAVLVLAAGVLMALGASAAGAWGFALVAIGYGLANNAMVGTEALLQHRISGRARATVTSVAGLVKEGAALVGFAAVGVIATGTSVPVAVAGVALVGSVLGSIAAWRALSRHGQRSEPTSEGRY